MCSDPACGFKIGAEKFAELSTTYAAVEIDFEHLISLSSLVEAHIPNANYTRPHGLLAGLLEQLRLP